jgi:TonB-linked SusC/RagA family outer membrane protein
MNSSRRMWGGLLAATFLLVGYSVEAQAQATGIIQGRVLEATSRQPLASVQVSVPGTQRGTLTDREGNFRIPGVPVGRREVRAELIGFTSMVRAVTVTAEGVATVEFELRQAVIDLEEIVVTGVAGEQVRAKLPFTVDRLTPAVLPVEASNAAAMVQGKVAGAIVTNPSGRPGTAPSVLLRGPTSINAAGRSQEPLYIVDGVILSASLIDIDAMDIESIEIVKGAAAASLYGSRAANGVIQITTQRGRNVADDQVRYVVRTEMGTGQLHGRFNLTQTHHFAMTPDGSAFINGATGQPCQFIECNSVVLAGQRALPGSAANEWNTIQQEAWPGQTYDHMDRFFRAGNTMTNYVSVAGRSGGTNYNLSYNRFDNEGILPYHEGELRHTFRLNVDQSMRQDLTVSASASFTRNRYQPNQGNMFQLTRMPAGVDLTMPDPTYPDHFILKPDPFNDNANPLTTMREQYNIATRGRFLGSVSTRWSPVSWFDIDGAVGFDRADIDQEAYIRRGVRNLNGVPGTGSISHNTQRIEGMNASLTGQARRTFGDLNTTWMVRYLMEREDNQIANVSSSQFIAEGVYTIGNTPSGQRNGSSSKSPERRDGFFVSGALDFRDRYIIDALVRQDGSSRFGAGERRQWYYRMAGKYRLSEEEFFNVPQIDELGFRYSIGTAGNTPRWTAQYETYSVTEGSITPVSLGNRLLKPEHATEQEMGIDLLFLGRFSADLTYARSDIKDQILQIPSLAYTGFTSQWLNAGRLESNTIETTLTAQFRPTRDLTWTSRLMFDRTRQRITELNQPAYQTGVDGQGLGDVFYVREGERIGTFYGALYASQCSHLPEGLPCDQFQVNDDGYLVWVGGAGSWQNGWNTYTDAEGETRQWWGTTSEFADARGGAIRWGTPLYGQAPDPITGEMSTDVALGNGMPDYSIGFSNTFAWRGFQLYGLLRSVQGFSVYNQPLQWAVFQSYAGIMDESGTSNEALRKPLGYYSALYGANGLNPSSAFVVDGSFIKLQELQLRYRAGRSVLDRVPVARGFDAITFSVTGQNLLTWSDYDGYDPDVGSTGGGTGSASIARVDGYSYPPYRTVKFGIELNF